MSAWLTLGVARFTLRRRERSEKESLSLQPVVKRFDLNLRMGGGVVVEEDTRIILFERFEPLKPFQQQSLRQITVGRVTYYQLEQSILNKTLLLC